MRSPTPGPALFVKAWFKDTGGRPVAGAEVDIWHSSSEGFYENQDPAQADMNLRGKFITDADGHIAFRTVMPAGYPVPIGGPVGELLRAQGRHNMRPAHLHFLASKDGLKTLISQVYVNDDPYLDFGRAVRRHAAPDRQLRAPRGCRRRPPTCKGTGTRSSAPSSWRPASRSCRGRRSKAKRQANGRRCRCWNDGRRARAAAMALHNTSDGYGALTKSLHWLVVALFAFQFAAANIMLRLDDNATAMGMGQSTYYNWHKSIGLVALVVAVVRVLARRRGQLPDWAPTLSERERAFIHRAEQVLYAAMFVMPVSGFLYVMAGGYGVNLFGVWELPNPIGARPCAGERREVDAHRERLRAGRHAGGPRRPGAVAHAGAEGRADQADAAATGRVKVAQVSSRHLLPGSSQQRMAKFADKWIPGTSPGMTLHSLPRIETSLPSR